MSVTATPAGEEKHLSAPVCRVAHAWLTEAIYTELERQAAALGLHTDVYAADLVAYMVLKKAQSRSTEAT
jgi:hypothetical protein